MPKKKTINLDQFFTATATDTDDLSFLLGAEPEETAQRAAERGLPLTHLPTSVIAPDPHQLRHLPHPTELRRLADEGDRAAGAVLAGLDELGRSMEEHGQIQPVVVYQDQDPKQPQITHRLLNGHRRWSAAVLRNLPSLWVVEVARPTEVFRLRQQFEENERREDFSDMERAWALNALKDALQVETGEAVSWGVIENQLQLSVQRRQDLLRLLRFSAEAQNLIRRYGWSEWTLRPLHMAINAGEVTQAEATDMLYVLAEREDVNEPIVRALVEGYRAARTSAAQLPEQVRAEDEIANRHNVASPTLQQTARLQRGIGLLSKRLPKIKDANIRAELRMELTQLRDAVQALLDQLA